MAGDTLPSRIRRADRGLTLNRSLLLGMAVVVAALLAYRQYDRFTNPRVPVWVSASSLSKGQQVADTSLVQVQLPRPKGALVQRTDIAGRTLVTSKPAGQPFYPADFAPTATDSSLSNDVPQGRVLATIRISAFDLPAAQLGNGDRIDIFQSSGSSAVPVARDAQIMGRMGTPASALVLAVRPEDVVSLTRAQGTRGALKMVLYAAADVRAGRQPNTLPVEATKDSAEADAPTFPVEVIHGTKTETVHVR